MPTKRASKASPKLRVPNQYHLTGEGIAITYYPGGLGPVRKGGPICLVYQDASRTVSFVKDELRSHESADLGTIVSVTIAETVDLGSTTFSVLIPDVRLPAEGSSAASIKTQGVTTFHRTFLAGPGQGQQETYSVASLAGEARVGPLAM